MKRFTLVASTVLAALALAGHAAPPAPLPVSTLKGEVLEVKDVKAFTYVRLRIKEGEIWAALPTTPVKKGSEITLYNPTAIANFESKSMGRKFDKIVFASLDPNGKRPPASAAPQGATATAAPAGPHGSMLPAVAPVGKVPRATGPDAKTVAEVVTGTAALKDKQVTIRGQVVKFSADILGKNWMHLQDGSGSAAAKSHDILVTTSDTAAVGDIVSASGTVRTNVDFGSGYAYAVLVENARIRK